jgi:alkanesulfonate monooxygenase SsuD/methylene tetrahydromethanopterin reductase-like flavin-dependent oxidoreductase (luciferase family)
MDFGYFTLSDNHYENNPRGPNQFVADILDEALFADQLGYHSAWIGEHHFSTLGVNSCPELLLSYLAARSKTIRLAPAVSVLPIHHPIRVAEAWATLDLISGGRVDFAAGRGYDEREYIPFGGDFANNQEIFEEGMEIVCKFWAADGPISHHGKHYQFHDLQITPAPVQRPMSAYVASFSKPSIELAGRLGCGLIVAPFAAAMTFGGLADVNKLYEDTCGKYGKKRRKLMCSYFVHFCDDAASEAAARARQMRYYRECVIPAFPNDRAKAQKSYLYMVEMVERLQKARAEDLNSNSVLLGNSAQMIETLKKVQAAGVEEVILYFNVGLKDHRMVKDEMVRFMEEVAPHFRRG